MPVSTTLDHITIVTDDFEASRPVYDAVLTAVGLRATVDYVDPEEDEDDTGTVAAIGYARPEGGALVLLVSGHRATVGAHFALTVSERHLVERAVAAAQEAGARIIQQPREWEAAHLNYYGAQIADATGNTIEVMHR